MSPSLPRALARINEVTLGGKSLANKQCAAVLLRVYVRWSLPYLDLHCRWKDQSELRKKQILSLQQYVRASLFTRWH